MTGVTVAPKTNNLEVGATRKLNVTVEPEGIETEFTYLSSDEAVVTVDENGLVAAIGEGTATITVQADGVTDTATVNVTVPDGPESIEINPKEHTFIDIWEPYTAKRFNVAILPVDADQTFTVESSDPSVFRARKEGMQAVAESIKSGTATLTVETANGLTATATITVPEQE